MKDELKDWKTWVLVISLIALVVFVIHVQNVSPISSGVVLNVTPGSPDPGQLQNIAQAFNAMGNTYTATPHPILSAGNSGNAQSKSQ